MSNTRLFTDFNSPDTGNAEGGATEAGITLTDTLEDWREKTNGIIEKVNGLGTEVVNIYSGQVDEHAINYSKIQEVNPKKLLGNTSSASGDVAEIEIDVTASGLQDSDVTIPTSKAVKDYVDDSVGSIVQQQYLRINTIDTFNAELIGTTGDRVTTVASTAGAKMINMQALNFSRDGTTAKDMYAGEISALRASITPVYANSLIAIEMVISCESNRYDAGLWVGELNASDEIQIITRSGYEGYNTAAATGRNNFYSSGFYDDNESSTMKSIPLTYIDKPNTTSAKTYSLIFASALANSFFTLNQTFSGPSHPNSFNFEYGVSTISIKEIRQ